ncbi:MAG: hypothetical protein AAGH99_05255 [Planctomycetota bacterium]
MRESKTSHPKLRLLEKICVLMALLAGLLTAVGVLLGENATLSYASPGGLRPVGLEQIDPNPRAEASLVRSADLPSLVATTVPGSPHELGQDQLEATASKKATGFDWLEWSDRLIFRSPSLKQKTLATSSPPFVGHGVNTDSSEAEGHTGHRTKIGFAVKRSGQVNEGNASTYVAQDSVNGGSAPQNVKEVVADKKLPGDDKKLPNHEAEIVNDYVSKLIAFYNIGFSSSDSTKRHVGRNIERDGWKGFVKKTVRPSLDWGFRRVQLHNPFGDDGEWPMELDQAIRAENEGFDYLTDGFVEAWRPVTRGDYTGGEPVEVVAYLGSYRLPEFEAMESSGDWPGWLGRAMQSVRLPLEAGMTLAFDSFVVAGPDSYAFRFVEHLRHNGHRVYIETWPNRRRTHWRHTNIVVAEQWFRRNHQSGNVVRREELTGEVVRLMAHTFPAAAKTPSAKVLSYVGSALSQGYSVSIHPRNLTQAVESAQELVETISDRRQASFD